MKFTVYGQYMDPDIPIEDLIESNRESGEFIARAEDSGSESTYVEVAKWSHTRHRWERCCFCKCMDYRLPGHEDATDRQTAIEAARLINEAGGVVFAKFIASLPESEPEEDPASLPSSEQS